MAARYRGVSAAWRRLLGEETLAPPRWPRPPTWPAPPPRAAPSPAGRSYAGHADLAWPDEPHLVLFHALTLLREHRGDGHVAALTGAGLSGLESLLSHTATGRGFTRTAAQATRGWSDEEWAAAARRPGRPRADDPDGGAHRRGPGAAGAGGVAGPTTTATPRGTSSARPGAQRLAELGRPLVATVRANGAFPDGVFARGR